MRTYSKESAIRKLAELKNINHLIHFTHISNLDSILRKGLIPRNSLSIDAPEAHINDEWRFDNHSDGNCLSISFPNYKMLYKYSYKNRQDWAIILINKAVLWEYDCAFFKTNAACKEQSSIPIGRLKEEPAFELMFEDTNESIRGRLGIPENYPTNPQAEVIAFGTIAPSAISSINFSDQRSCENWVHESKNSQADLIAKTNKNLFTPRHDWEHWQAGEFSPEHPSTEQNIPF